MQSRMKNGAECCYKLIWRVKIKVPISGVQTCQILKGRIPKIPSRKLENHVATNGCSTLLRVFDISFFDILWFDFLCQHPIFRDNKLWYHDRVLFSFSFHPTKTNNQTIIFATCCHKKFSLCKETLVCRLFTFSLEYKSGVIMYV